MVTALIKKISISKLDFILLLACMVAAAGCSSGSGSIGSSSSAANYYVDATQGNDSNPGTSASSPWKTLGKIASSTFAPGSFIYLKRNETWNEQLIIPSSGITIDAYGSGALPVIDGSANISGWTNEGNGVYSSMVSLVTGEALGNIAENGIMMSFIPWDTDFTTTLVGVATGSYSYDNSSNTIYIKPATAPSGNTYTVSKKLYGISIDTKTDILISNINLTRFSLNGVNFQNCIRCSVENSSISNGGGAVIGSNSSAPPDYIYAGNGVEYDTSSSSGLVENVAINNIFDSGISPQTYANNQTTSGIAIQNSTIDKCGFAGVEISVLSNGGTTGSSISNITLSGMVITNSGHGWSGRRYGTEGHGIRIMSDSGAGTMSNIRVRTSTISGSAGDGVYLAGEIGAVTLDRTNINNNNHGINVSEPTATSLKLILTASLIYNNANYGIFFNAPAAAGFDVFQNTFYNNTAINLAVFNQSGAAKLQNNIFDSSGAMTHLYTASTLTGAVVNNNCYHEVANMFGYNSVAYSTVAALHAATGSEANGFGGTTVLLTNPAGEDFTLQPGSPCRGLGSASPGVATDFSGRSYSSPPSSGAYEFF